MAIVGVVADANVLLSAVAGKGALRVFTESLVEVHVSSFNANEVTEYLPVMAETYGLPVELVELQWKLLPLKIHTAREYRGEYDGALEALKGRDPEDAHVLALSKSLSLPIWSNDRDLTSLHIECYTTAQLLRILGQQPK